MTGGLMLSTVTPTTAERAGASFARASKDAMTGSGFSTIWIVATTWTLAAVILSVISTGFTSIAAARPSLKPSWSKACTVPATVISQVTVVIMLLPGARGDGDGGEGEGGGGEGGGADGGGGEDGSGGSAGSGELGGTAGIAHRLQERRQRLRIAR